MLKFRLPSETFMLLSYVFQAKQVVILEHYNTQIVPCSNTGRPKKDIRFKKELCSFSSTNEDRQKKKIDVQKYNNMRARQRAEPRARCCAWYTEKEKNEMRSK